MLTTIRKTSIGLFAAVCLAVAANFTLPAVRAADNPPNIVLIISDDHGWTDYGFMGHPHIKTPHLDRLASQSLVFPRGYVAAPLCCPSLASIVTGLYPHQHRITSNDPPGPRRDPVARESLIRLIDKVPTLPRMLSERDYVSFQAGKWWLGDYARGGFTAGMTHGDVTRGGRHGDAGLKIGRESMKPVLDFIRDAKRQDRPFFVWYAPMMPHAPHNPPQRLLDKYRDAAPSLPIARYWAMVDWFDETCGELLDFLDAQDLTADTLVLYVADNGMLYKDDGTEYRSKRTPYEMGIRTPIMVRWPGHVRPGRSDTPVSSIDLVPTALAAAGIEKPTRLPGVSLLNREAVAGRGPLFGAAFRHDAVDLANPATSLQYRYVIDDDWKLILSAPDRADWKATPPELYNIVQDPQEKQNLAEREPDRVQRLKQRMDAWWSPQQ